MNLYRIMSAEQAAKVLASAKGWRQGKARTPELTGTVKQNEEILASQDKDARKVLNEVARLVMAHPDIQLDCMPRQIHTPKFSRYTKGAHYKEHTDAPWMGQTRTDLAMTLFLSDPESYEGGELIIQNPGRDSSVFRGQAGECAVYNCGEIHEVLPVTAGERVCIVSWIQSIIRDPRRRRLATEFRRLLSELDGRPEYLQGSRIYSDLLRMWTE